MESGTQAMSMLSRVWKAVLKLLSMLSRVHTRVEYSSS